MQENHGPLHSILQRIALSSPNQRLFFWIFMENIKMHLVIMQLYISASDIELPYWLMNSEELISIVC